MSLNSISYNPSIALSSAHNSCSKEQVIQTSFHAQFADHSYFRQPTPFKGTCATLLKGISETVHSTVDSLDYNGLQPFTKLTEQLEDGIPLAMTNIDSRGEEHGSTCLGMSYAIMKALAVQHGITSTLAVQRMGPHHQYEHAAVIIECTDGLVLLDARADPKTRLYTCPYNSTITYPGFTLITASKGDFPLITVRYHGRDSFDYYTHVPGSDDEVMKHYMKQCLASFTPIAVYEQDGRAFKSIKVYPSLAKVTFKNHRMKEEETLFFDEIKQSGTWQRLKDFMGLDFHTPPQQVYEQIATFVSHHQRIMQVFSSACQQS